MPWYSWRSVLLTSGRAASLFHIIQRGQILRGISSTIQGLHTDSYLPTTKSMQINSTYIWKICSDCQDLPVHEVRYCVRKRNNDHSYAVALQMLNQRTVQKRRIQIDAVLVINIFWGSKSCPSFMDIIDLRVPTLNLQHLHLFRVSPHIRNCNKFRL